MKKSAKPDRSRAELKAARWVLSVFIFTFIISGIIGFISEEVLAGSGLVSAFVILCIIIIVGIVFDTLGVAVTTADESPFHAMASRKVLGAREAIQLLRKAERVSSICNDVIGDICGVVSGAAATAIATRVCLYEISSNERMISLVMSASVAAFTVGGKAMGKNIAMQHNTGIVYIAGKTIAHGRRIKNVLLRRH